MHHVMTTAHFRSWASDRLCRKNYPIVLADVRLLTYCMSFTAVSSSASPVLQAREWSQGRRDGSRMVKWPLNFSAFDTKMSLRLFSRKWIRRIESDGHWEGAHIMVALMHAVGGDVCFLSVICICECTMPGGCHGDVPNSAFPFGNGETSTNMHFIVISYILLSSLIVGWLKSGQTEDKDSGRPSFKKEKEWKDPPKKTPKELSNLFGSYGSSEGYQSTMKD